MSIKNPSVLWTVNQGLNASEKELARDNIGISGIVSQAPTNQFITGIAEDASTGNLSVSTSRAPVTDVKVKAPNGTSISAVDASTGVATIAYASAVTHDAGITMVTNEIIEGDTTQIAATTPKGVSDFVTNYARELIVISGDVWQTYIVDGVQDKTTFTKAQEILGRNHLPVIAVYNPTYHTATEWGYHMFYPLDYIGQGCALVFYSDTENKFYRLLSGNWTVSNDVNDGDRFIDYDEPTKITSVIDNYNDWGKATYLRLPPVHNAQIVLPLHRIDTDAQGNIIQANWVDINNDSITTYSVTSSNWTTSTVSFGEEVFHILYGTSAYSFAEVLQAFNMGRVLQLTVNDAAIAPSTTGTIRTTQCCKDSNSTYILWTYTKLDGTTLTYRLKNDNTWES